MEQSRKLIHKTKKKFFIYSFIGVLLVSFVSYFALDIHRKIVAKQASIQAVYKIVSKQFNLVNKISILSEMFDDSSKIVDITALEAEFRTLIKQLNLENERLNRWVSKGSLAETTSIEGVLEDEDVKNKMSLFIKRANELINNDSLTNLEIRQNIRFLTDSSTDGLGDVLGLVSKRLENEQEHSLSLLNKVGFVLVGLCVLQVLLVWLLVFRPLYGTILIQHNKLTDALLRAKSASRSKTDFLANISHEIRTPMTAILGYADILKRSSISNDEKEDSIKIINQNATHLLSLIDEILDISKIEAGRFEFENERVNLSTFLNEVYSLINVKSEDKGIELIFKNEGRIPEFINADPKRLKQILFNILGNAIKFTDRGYVELVVSYSKQSNKLLIQVHDTGTGISEEQVKKLFRPFEQADTSVARKYGGTGLGLVLSKGLAQGMGGDVRILESKVGVGTTMEIVIDVGDIQNDKLLATFSTNVVEDRPIEIEASQLKDTKILVVDDAKENARLFKMYLSEAGASVVMANDGQTAIDTAKQSFFDIILLDLQMPGKDGFQVIKELRENAFKRPIVALTAHAMKEEKEKTKNAGFDDHITKPVTPTDLINSVSQLVKDHNTIRMV